jgi:hypothetical protein
MSPEGVFEVIRQRLSQWVSIDAAVTVFVADDVLIYSSGERVRAPRAAGFRLGDAGAWERLLAGTPSWLHANLLFTTGGDPVVSLRRGPDVLQRTLGPDGLPSSINVSKEALPLQWIT